MHFFKYILFLILLLNSLFSFAGDAGQILQQERELQRLQQIPQAIPDTLQIDDDRPIVEDLGPKIWVKKVSFKGNEVFTDEELLEQVNAFINQQLSFTEIQQIAATISKFYQDQGYFLAQAILPKQEIVNDTIEIIIQEGALDPNQPLLINDTGAVGFPLRLKQTLIEDYIIADKNQLKIKQDDLERGILNLNDNPGITSAANIAPGNSPGTSKIILDVAEGPRWDGSIAADNYGSRYTGQDRLTTMVNLNNPSGYGDKVNFMTVNAIEEPFHLHRLAYEFPLGRKGLRANIAFSELDYTLGKTLATTPSSGGAAYNWSADVKYPIYRTAEKAWFIGGGYDWKSIKSSASGVRTANKNLYSYKLNSSGQLIDKLFGGGFTLADMSYTTGELDLIDNLTSYTNDQGSGGARTDGAYQKINMQVVRIQRGTDKLSFQMIYNQQWAFTNLDGAEKMILGGPAGVRAYPPGEAAGDEGHRLSVDAKYIMLTGSRFGDVIGSIYYDYGQIHQNDRPHLVTVTKNSYSLEGWGLGLDMVSAGKYSVKAGWAKKIGDNPSASSEGKDVDGFSRDSRWWIQGSVFF